MSKKSFLSTPNIHSSGLQHVGSENKLFGEIYWLNWTNTVNRIFESKGIVPLATEIDHNVSGYTMSYHVNTNLCKDPAVCCTAPVILLQILTTLLSYWGVFLCFQQKPYFITVIKLEFIAGQLSCKDEHKKLVTWCVNRGWIYPVWGHSGKKS